MTTASQKVFATVELLEMILFKFPTNSLLQSQRISKHFKAVIETSKKLQQALFIEPIRIDDGILTYLPDFFGDDGGAGKGTWIFPGGGLNYKQDIIIFMNPLILPLIEAMGDLDTKGRGPLMNTLPRSWRHPKASWRKMLVTQPSMKSRICYYEQPVSDHAHIGTHTFDTGRFRLNDIVNWLNAELKANKVTTAFAEFDAQHELLVLETSEHLQQVGQKNGPESDSEGDDEDGNSEEGETS